MSNAKGSIPVPRQSGAARITRHDPLLDMLSAIAFGLAAAEAVAGVVIGVTGNPEGWAGSVFYVLMYSVPLAVIGLLLRAHDSGAHKGAAWFGLLLAAFYTLVVIGNWSGYSGAQALLALVATIPTVIFYLVVFWAAVLHGSSGARA